MISTQDIEKVIGATVRSEDGDRIGKVETVYVDDATDAPTFALVKTERVGSGRSFVPLEDATLDDDVLRVAHTKDRVLGAPDIAADGHLQPGSESELYLYYGLPYAQEFGETLRDDPAAAPRPVEDAPGAKHRGAGTRLRRHGHEPATEQTP